MIEDRAYAIAAIFFIAYTSSYLFVKLGDTRFQEIGVFYYLIGIVVCSILAWIIQ